MAHEQPNESSALLDSASHRPAAPPRHDELHNSHYDGDVESLYSSVVSKDERALHGTSVGERLPYNDYTTIDWLHDLVKDSLRYRRIHSRHDWRGRLTSWWDSAQGWVAATLIGLITALVAFVVDVSVATVADWKEGWCSRGWWLDRNRCCETFTSHSTEQSLAGFAGATEIETCHAWKPWETTYGGSYGIYVAFALAYGILAGSVTLLTRSNLPAVDSLDVKSNGQPEQEQYTETSTGKMMYMAAGSGIPEIKTILSGFVIPHFLDFKVLVVKAVGATFAVSTGMCLGKEGPFVHISTCVGHLVAVWFPKYKTNQRKMREMLSVACSAGLSVAFGAPIGGVLFSYEEISTYFPRQVMWKSFLCSLVAAAALKELNPTGTGKLVLFETNYGIDYDVVHYLVFILLGVCGGVFGGVFCKANFRWSKFFRKFSIIKKNPVLEVFLVVLVTALLQYPNRLIRPTGDIVMSELLVNCSNSDDTSYICQQESMEDKRKYYAWLITGTLTKLVLTIITFGCKVPSGIIIPALDAGALFGRMVGQLVPNISPGIFAMVGSAAFLAGVSRMTVSLAVIMFELTGEVNFIPPFMIAILTSKWVADAISSESVYDLSQHLLGHPFLDAEHALSCVRASRTAGGSGSVEDLIPPSITMSEITLYTGPNFRVRRDILQHKLLQLKARGLMDAGLVLVNDHGICHGYLPEAELDFALHATEETSTMDESDAGEIDLFDGLFADFIDRCPLTLSAKAPVEYAVEMFGKLGLRYLIVTREETTEVVGVVIKKRLVNYLDGLRGI